VPGTASCLAGQPRLGSTNGVSATTGAVYNDVTDPDPQQYCNATVALGSKRLTFFTSALQTSCRSNLQEVHTHSNRPGNHGKQYEHVVSLPASQNFESCRPWRQNPKDGPNVLTAESKSLKKNKKNYISPARWADSTEHPGYSNLVCARGLGVLGQGALN
jgi:hypothetical protein